MAYDPLTGAGYNQSEASQAWAESMQRVHREKRAPLRWQLHGGPGNWHWVFWNFGPWAGQVSAGRNGFLWQIRSYDTGQMLFSGVTTSLFEAYQSVEQGHEVTREGTVPVIVRSAEWDGIQAGCVRHRTVATWHPAPMWWHHGHDTCPYLLSAPAPVPTNWPWIYGTYGEQGKPQSGTPGVKRDD